MWKKNLALIGLKFAVVACFAQTAVAQSLRIDGANATEVDKLFISQGGYGSNWLNDPLEDVYKELPRANHVSMISGDCEADSLVYAQITAPGSTANTQDVPYLAYCKDGKFSVPIYAVNGVAQMVGIRTVDLLVRKCRFDRAVSGGIECFGPSSTAPTSEVRMRKTVQVSDVELRNDDPGKLSAFGSNRYLSLFPQPGSTLLSMPGNNYVYVLAAVGNSAYAILPGNFDPVCTSEGKFPPPPLKISFDGQCYDMVVVPSQNLANEWLINYQNGNIGVPRITFSFGSLLSGMSGQVRFFGGFAKDLSDLVENHRWHAVGVYYD
jgi:hypothetical protein